MNALSKVCLHDEVWNVISGNAFLRKRLDAVVRRVEHFCVNHLRIQDDTIRKVPHGYKVRLTKALRMPFTLERMGDEGWKATFWAILDHKEGEVLHSTGIQAGFEEDLHTLDADPIEPDTHMQRWAQKAPLFRVSTPEEIRSRVMTEDSDLPWDLGPEQRALVERPGPILINGAAGSGKTTVALYRMVAYAHEQGVAPLYVTYTRRLLKHAEKQFAQLSAPTVAKPVFSTLDDLCRSCIPDVQARFPQDRYVGAQAFKRAPFLRSTKLLSSPEVYWEEFRGVIKGGYQNVERNVPYMDKDFYVNQVPQKQSLFHQDDRPRVYDTFKAYQDWLKREERWDDIDLARVAIQGARPQTFSQVFVDEVQDLTTFHLAFILRFCETYDGLFLAGDPQQVIHPSRFEWDRIKTQLFTHFSGVDRRLGEKLKPHTIEVNYRSAQPIVDVANYIVEWRKEELRERYMKLRAVRSGGPLCHLPVSAGDALSGNERLTHRLMVIVPNEVAAAEALNRFGQGYVFTVHEAKGLEADYVVLWNFFSPTFEDWLFQSDSRRKGNGHSERLRYQTNLLNVALTRAREALFFLDDHLPKTWEPFSRVKWERESFAHARFQAILQEQSSEKDYTRTAADYEMAGQYEQAIGMYENAGARADAERVRGIIAEQAQEWLKAAGHYRTAEVHSDAARCYEKAGLDFERFEMLLRSEDAYAGLQIDEYLKEPKKLMRLTGNVPEAIVRSIIDTERGEHVDTLFKYALNKSRHQRDDLRTKVNDFMRLTTRSRDYTRSRSTIQQALNALNATYPIPQGSTEDRHGH